MLACWQLNEGLARQLRELVYYIIYHYSKLCYIKHISISIIIICISIVNIIIRITICSIIIISISISTPQERPQAADIAARPVLRLVMQDRTTMYHYYYYYWR